MDVFDLARARGFRQRLGCEKLRRTSPVTVILPFYNEAKFIHATLNSLMRQNIPPQRIVLVDNGSSDNSAQICRMISSRCAEVESVIINANRPGKIYALNAGQKLITTEFVAFCDADTYYPPHYFEKGIEILGDASESVVGVLAPGVAPAEDSRRAAFQLAKTVLAGKLLAKQCHSGGFGQIFRTQAFLAVGGYDPSIWPFVLEDHEIVHRLLAQGSIIYDANFWCTTSPRRADRNKVSWSLFEQIVYHLTPFRLKDWFFYSFLANRLRKRGLYNHALREQPWAA